MKIHTSTAHSLILNYVHYRVWNAIRYFGFKSPYRLTNYVSHNNVKRSDRTRNWLLKTKLEYL